MPNYTSNYNLVKPLETDFYDVEVQNGNMDSIDTALNNKVDKVTGKGLSTEDYTSVEKTKLSGIADNANNYSHPSTHSADIIVDGTTNKAFTAAEKTKLNGIAAGAQVNTVTSVASKTGAVTLVKGDVGLTNVDNVKQMPIAGGTFTGQAKAQNNTAYTTAQLRNVTLSTADPSGGGNGDVWLKYKP